MFREELNIMNQFEPYNIFICIYDLSLYHSICTKMTYMEVLHGTPKWPDIDKIRRNPSDRNTYSLSRHQIIFWCDYYDSVSSWKDEGRDYIVTLYTYILLVIQVQMGFDLFCIVQDIRQSCCLEWCPLQFPEGKRVSEAVSWYWVNPLEVCWGF